MKVADIGRKAFADMSIYIPADIKKQELFLPMMWSTSAGSDVMKRIAAPMIGGMVSSFMLELPVYPLIYKLWKQRELS